MASFGSTEKLKDWARAGAGTFFGLKRLVSRRPGTTHDEKACPLIAACKSIEESIAKQERVEELLPELKLCFELFAATVNVDATSSPSSAVGTKTGSPTEGTNAATELSEGAPTPNITATAGKKTVIAGEEDHHSSASGTPISTPSTPSNVGGGGGAGSARNFAPPSNTHESRAFESSILYFMDFLQMLQKNVGVHATKAMVLNSVLNNIVKALALPLPVKVADCFVESLKHYLLLDKHFSSCLQDLCQILRDGVANNAVQLRLLLLLHQLLRSTDLDEVHSGTTSGGMNGSARSDSRVADSETLKSRLAEHGLIELLLGRATEIKEILLNHRTPSGSTVDITTTFGVGTMCVCVLLSLARNHPQHKQKLLTQPFFSLWVYFSSNSSKLYCTYTFTVTLRGGTQQEQTIVYETPGFWYGDLAEGLIELSTEGQSFSMKRQELQTLQGSGSGATVPGAPGTPGASTGPASTATGAGSAVAVQALQQWMPLPEKWSSVLTSGSMFVWRFSSACVQCLFSEKSSQLLLWALGRMSIVSHVSCSIYCNVMHSIVLLTKASPLNGGILMSSGAFKQVIGIISPRSCVFKLEENKEVIVDLHGEDGNDTAWELTLALLTALMSTQFCTEELAVIMEAIQEMVAVDYDDLKGQDCEVIEHCNHVLACQVYSPYYFWFDGTLSTVSTVMNKYPGSWHGYTFTCWLNTVCVWPEGGLLYSFTEPTGTSSLALLVVANGKSKCLAVRSSTQKGEVTITMLPDTALGDEWTHIAIVHNTSMSAWINGKKAFQKKDIPYPKEPTKPHKLTFSVGGDRGEVKIPPLFGMMTSVQLVDTYLEEKNMMQSFNQGPGAPQNFDPAQDKHLLVGVKPTNPPILVGHAVQPVPSSPTTASIRAVFYHQTPSLATAMAKRDMFDWFGDIFIRAADSDNFIGVTILSTQLMAVYLKQHPEARNTWFESKAFWVVASLLRQWECVPHEVLCHVLHLCTGRDSRLVSHPSTSAILQLLLDCVSSPICLGSSAKETQKGVFDELGPMLALEENARVFRETPRGFAQLLDCAKDVDESCISSFINVLEKLVRGPAEMEHTIKFLIHDPESSRSTIIKCELLRMLYDIAKPVPQVVDVLVLANGIEAILMLIHGSVHRSESLRVYALRLLGLVLHVSRRARDPFMKANGFDQVAHSLLRHALAAPIGLPTYNCIFKFGLDFFQPHNSDEFGSSVFSPIPDGGSNTTSGGGGGRVESGRHLDPTKALMGGHLPGILPKGQTPMMRSYGSATGSNSECSDLEARLSLDDAYNAQVQRDKLVYPQCVSIALQLLSQSFNTLCAANTANVFPEDSQPAVNAAVTEDGVAAGELVSDSRGDKDTSSEASETSVTVIYRVLNYIDRMCELAHNAAAMLPHPWLEWLLGPYQAFLEMETKLETVSRNQILGLFRSIIRKLSVADLGRQGKQTMLKKVKEMCDVPHFQVLVIAEVVQYFGTHNSLDAITDASIAQNSLRNLDSLLLGIDECVQNLPQELSLEIVTAISSIAIHNNNWVRAKMKEGRLFETRNQLAYHMFTTVKNFTVEDPAVLSAIVKTVGCLSDQNVAAYTVKLIMDAVTGGGVSQHLSSGSSVLSSTSSTGSGGDPDIEKLEVVQGIARTLGEEAEHYRHFLKMLGDQETVDLLLGLKGETGRISPSTVKERTDSGLLTSTPQRNILPSTHLVAFAQQNEKKWVTLVVNFQQRFGKKLDLDLQSRSDVRERDTNTKLKQRRAEVERRQSSSARVAADVDKLVSESSTRGGSFSKELIEQRTSKQKRTVDASTYLEAQQRSSGGA